MKISIQKSLFFSSILFSFFFTLFNPLIILPISLLATSALLIWILFTKAKIILPHTSTALIFFLILLCLNWLTDTGGKNSSFYFYYATEMIVYSITYKNFFYYLAPAEISYIRQSVFKILTFAFFINFIFIATEFLFLINNYIYDRNLFLQSSVIYPIGHRAFGFSLEPGYQGALMTMLFPFAYITLPKYTSIIFIALIISLVVTSSLTGLLLLAIILLYFSIRKSYMDAKFSITTILITLILFTFSFKYMKKYYIYFYNNFITSLDLSNESANDRYSGFINGINLLIDSKSNFIFGHGLSFSSYENLNFVNTYLMVAVDGGLFLLSLLIIYFIYTFLNIQRISQIYKMAFLASLGMMYINLFFNQLFFLPHNFVFLNLVNSGLFFEKK